jgi:divalent anion:Na+ symporter, DASS family
MQLSFESVESLLIRVPFFQTLDRVDLARLAGALEEVRFPASTEIFSENAEADALYLLASGRVEVTVGVGDSERQVAVLEAPSYFGELGLLLVRRTGSVRASTDIHAWKLPRERFDQLARERSAIALAVATSLALLLDQRSREHVGAPVAEQQVVPVEVPEVGRQSQWRIAGAAIALGVPFGLWWIGPPAGMSVPGWHTSLTIIGAALAWLFEPVPDFVTALAMLISWGLLRLAPLSMAFAGFSSSSWFVALGAMGIGVAMTRSGLFLRLILFVLKILPAQYSAYLLGLLVGGVVTTPAVPVPMIRVATITPLVHELAQTLGYPAGSRTRAGLAAASIIGFGFFGSIFLTGRVENFFLIGLLGHPDDTRFSWIPWLVGAAPAGAVLLVGAAVMLLALYRSKLAPRATIDVLRLQRRLLGPLSPREIITIAALALLIAGLFLEQNLQVDVAWISLAAFLVALAGGVIDRASFRGSLEWGFLIFFAVLLSTGGVLRGAGVDQWIATALVPLAQTVHNPSLLVMLLGVLVVGCRVVLPATPTILLLSVALVPVASHVGLSPWVVGFVIITAGTPWLHASQSLFYRLATEGGMMTPHDGTVVGVVMTLITLAGIAASVPYWRMLGLISP